MPSSTKGRGAWVTGVRPVGVVLEELLATEERLAILRYRTLDEAILTYVYRHYMLREAAKALFQPAISPQIYHVIANVIKKGPVEKVYDARVEQLRAWGWFSQGPEGLTREE